MPRKSHKNKVYSAELKLQAVHDYLAHKGSQRELCRKYEIEHHSGFRAIMVIKTLKSALAPEERSI